MGITGEIRIKRQKNGTTHRYVYYHCTKKSKTRKCPEPHIRAEELDRQLSALLTRYAMPQEWAAKLSVMLDTEETKATRSASAVVQELRAQADEFSRNLARLTDLYVAQDIERDDYLERRRSLMSEKKSVEEQIALLERTPSAWIEPTREWIKDAEILDEIAKNDDLPSKKSSLQKIFGSNLTLHAREACGVGVNQWLSLANAKEKFSKNDLSLLLECLLNEARTNFSKNGGTLPSHSGSHSLLTRMTRQKS